MVSSFEGVEFDAVGVRSRICRRPAPPSWTGSSTSFVSVSRACPCPAP